jgi:hypothetical protein
MKNPVSRLQVYQEGSPLFPSACCAVSLHSHTHYSQDQLSFLPHYASQIPIVDRLFQYEMERYWKREGKRLDFSKFHWNPPASPEMVWDSEQAQIQDWLGLQALVSITDHDDISAGLQLCQSRLRSTPPISTEWSVPYAETVFHLGVHNLPSDSAQGWMDEMQKYRSQPNPERLRSLLAGLSAMPQVLVVMNHPLWDQADREPGRQEATARQLLQECHEWIHALEFNGHRSHAENQEVMRLAASCRLPVLAGGDRHGLTANAVLTLSSTNSFEEFVSGIRARQSTEILLLPHYFDHRAFRSLQTVKDALGHYRDFPAGWRRWTDRITICLENEEPRPLSHHWRHGGPRWLQLVLWVTGLLGSRPSRLAFQLAQPMKGEIAL